MIQLSKTMAKEKDKETPKKEQRKAVFTLINKADNRIYTFGGVRAMFAFCKENDINIGRSNSSIYNKSWEGFERDSKMEGRKLVRSIDTPYVIITKTELITTGQFKPNKS